MQCRHCAAAQPFAAGSTALSGRALSSNVRPKKAMHIPHSIFTKPLAIFIKWVRIIIGKGLPKYPLYTSHDQLPFTPAFQRDLSKFLDSFFCKTYETNTYSKISEWLQVFPPMYTVVIDRQIFSKNPFKKLIVGSYKIVPLSREATKAALSGNFEACSIPASDIAPSLDKASGIWVGDLAVSLSYRLTSYGNVIGCSLIYNIRSKLQPYIGVKPIFARSEREDVRQLLLDNGFVPLSNGATVSKQTILVLQTAKKRKNFSTL